MAIEFRDRLSKSGAVWDPASSRPLHFGDPARELDAALERCVLADRSDLGRLLATGPDLLDLLHRLSTADVLSLTEGRGRPAVLTTPKGRIVQRVFVHHLGRTGVLVLSGPGGSPRVKAHLDRFTFREETGVTDVTSEWTQLALLGPLARRAADAAGLGVPDGHGSAPATLGGAAVHVLGGDGVSKDGVTIIVPGRGATKAWEALGAAVRGLGGRHAGDHAVEAWRVLRGLPENGFELTEDHNPLEAGLREAVSFDKGCYVGQEVVARLNTYDKVARHLRGLVFPPRSSCPAPGTALYDRGRQVGEITSSVLPPGRTSPVAMAYVKRDAAEAGRKLVVGAGEAALTPCVTDLPFGDTP